MDGVDAGGAGFLISEVGGYPIQAGEYLGRREIQGGQRG
jgi:hypothetical protein